MHTDQSFQMGDIIQLEFVEDEQRGRYYVKIVGFREGHSLIVSTPTAGGSPLLIRENQSFVARMLAANQVFGFNCTVLRSNMFPYPYLHLSYPTTMEKVRVRQVQRVDVDVIASVQNDCPEKSFAEPLSVVLKDLSTSGAMIRSEIILGEIDDPLTISTRVQIDEIGEQYLSAKAIIRSVNQREEEDINGGGQYSHGVEFLEMDQETALIVHGYVYQQIAKSRRTV